MKDKDNQKKKVEEESRSQIEPWHVQVILTNRVGHNLQS